MDSQKKMRLSAALLDRFLANKCSAEEATCLVEYFQERPEELDEYLRNDWNKTNKKKLPVIVSAEMLNDIKQRASLGYQSPVKSMYVRWISVAAALLVCAIALWLVVDKKSSASTVSAKQIEKASVKWVWKFNTSDDEINIELPDGSTALLSPGGAIKFREDFAPHARDIYLHGKGFFDVRKDSSKPFTVFTKSFSTTALGTTFSVEENEETCEVKLHSGKVVIRASKNISDWKDVYLLAGQRMLYMVGRHTVSIGKFSDKAAESGKISREDNFEHALNFEHTPLKEVLEELSKHYHTSIEFNTALTNEKYFTGTVLPNDKLHMLLPVIATMNGMEVRPTANGYRLQ